MTDRDPAFLWETEAMRSAAHRVTEQELDAGAPSPDSRWATLREANRQTAIPVETLRKWARRGSVPSYLSPTNHGVSLRMVDLDAVRQRAIELGRAETPIPPPEPTQQTAIPPEPDAVTSPATAANVPPGSMIIPVDAWNKMLNQLGNLHEAGQQLAEARERAAKAETEAKFLRERLAELRRQRESQPATPQPEGASSATSETPSSPQAHERVWRYVVKRWQDRRPG